VGKERKSPLGAANAAATGLERFNQASPVGTIAAVSEMPKWVLVVLLYGVKLLAQTALRCRKSSARARSISVVAPAPLAAVERRLHVLIKRLSHSGSR
jgi:hypothetical protein